MAVVVTKTDLVLHFAEFSGVDEARVTGLNPTMNLFVVEDVLGDASVYAGVCMIAHILKMSDNEGAGPLVSEKVGDLSRGYGAITSDDALGLTSYGQEYLRILRSQIPSTMGIVN